MTEDFNKEDRYQRIQRLQADRSLYAAVKAPHTRQRAVPVLAYVAIASVGLIAVAVASAHGCKPAASHKPTQLNCVGCHKRMAMTEYFRKAGSKTPEQMAEAVLATKSPRLMAAIAKVETGGNHHVRKTGYKKRHDGAFQINARHWGKVSDNPVEQALQAERILTELTNEMPIKQALSQYGGDSTSKYQKRILAELVRVP